MGLPLYWAFIPLSLPCGGVHESGCDPSGVPSLALISLTQL